MTDTHWNIHIDAGDESVKISKEALGHDTEEIEPDVLNDFRDDSTNEMFSARNKNCWMSLNAKQHFQVMDHLDERYRKARSDYQKQLGEEFDKEMLDTLLKWRGVAQREAFKTSGKTNLIPAGLNLGGYCMMKMKDSVLFFHRIKLRNQTHFRVNFLHTDVENMVLLMHLSLNDLHLLGAYERSPVDKDPSVLFYAPTFGEVEFLMKNVDYKMEAQLRLTNNKLIIELVTSKLSIEDILMMYMNRADHQKPIRMIKDNIEDVLDRMKTDLDEWLKDYFNDYLTYFGSLKAPTSEFTKAEHEKIIALNEYADSSINIIKNRLLQLGADNVKIPHFTIFGPDEMKFQLKDGSLLGLDSIYRRSVTTAKKENDVRKINLIVGFSHLKVMYKYEASLRVLDLPILHGIIVLTADEITARMELSLVKEPETVDLEFDFIQQMKPESLTVEGAASRMIANFKHLLEHHIIAIMANAVIHNIKMLRTLSRCEPMLLSQHKPNNFVALSKINAMDAGTVEEETDVDLQKANSQTNYKSSIESTDLNAAKINLQNPSNIFSNTEVLSGGMPMLESNETSSEIINSDTSDKGDKSAESAESAISSESGKSDISDKSDNSDIINKSDNSDISDKTDGLLKSDDDVSEVNYSSDKKSDKHSTNNIKFDEISNHNQSDDELNSGMEYKNPNKSTSSKDNKTKISNIDDGFIISRNDSVELELSGTDNFKGGKYKLTREEKMKLSKE